MSSERKDGLETIDWGEQLKRENDYDRFDWMCKSLVRLEEKDRARVLLPGEDDDK